MSSRRPVMCIRNLSPASHRERGLSLIELVLFITIVSVAVVGLLQVMNLNTRHSVDPLLQKQALAIAEALLEEVEMMPFTICDPDDGADANPATCTREDAIPIGPEAGETRSGATPFDNVSDYDGFTLSGGGTDLGGAPNVV